MVDCSYVIVLLVHLNVGKYESTYRERTSPFACVIILHSLSSSYVKSQLSNLQLGNILLALTSKSWNTHLGISFSPLLWQAMLYKPGSVWPWLDNQQTILTTERESNQVLSVHHIISPKKYSLLFYLQITSQHIPPT